MYNIGELQPHYAFLHQVKFGELPRLPEAPLLAGQPPPPFMGSNTGGAEDTSGGFTLRLETLPTPPPLPPMPEAAAQLNSSSSSSSSSKATSSEPSSYDVIVVGAGLVGSAAARHVVTMDPILRVLLIGPAEGNDCGVAAEHDDDSNAGGGGGSSGSNSNSNSSGSVKSPTEAPGGEAAAGKKDKTAGAWHPSAARCHADEGRITRRLDGDPVWATLAARSIDR